MQEISQSRQKHRGCFGIRSERRTPTEAVLCQRTQRDTTTEGWRLRLGAAPWGGKKGKTGALSKEFGDGMGAKEPKR